jgi:predicted amino acid-binding ACT domain protein
MRIKIWASIDSSFPDAGPYKMLDILERDSHYSVGDVMHYGIVTAVPPPFALPSEDVEQSVIVRLEPSSLTARPDESVFEKPPTSYDRIEYFPILVDRIGINADTPSGTYTILAAENLTIEDVSQVIAPDAFSLWKSECFLSRDTARDLEGTTYAIVRRYSTETERDVKLESYSAEVVDMAVACLSLIRPTRRSRAGSVTGRLIANGVFVPQSFRTTNFVEVPEIQKLFTIRSQDIDLLRNLLPEFIQLYQRDGTGELKDEYEPIRMAVQLYDQAYEIPHWKARHILWWAAIESLYGNNEDAVIARIYAFLGNKDMSLGFQRSIYEKGDIPSCFTPSPDQDHKLGEVVPLIYRVRNESAHGQKVPNPRFTHVSHPLDCSVCLLDVLAEAVTFIIRKTVIEILRRGFRDKFKDRGTREDFWLREYGLNSKQSKKRLSEMDSSNPKCPPKA